MAAVTVAIVYALSAAIALIASDVFGQTFMLPATLFLMITTIPATAAGSLTPALVAPVTSVNPSVMAAASAWTVPAAATVAVGMRGITPNVTEDVLVAPIVIAPSVPEP